MNINWAAISAALFIMGGVGSIALVEYGNIRVLQNSISELALSHRQLVDEYIKLQKQIRHGRERLARVEAMAHQHQAILQQSPDTEVRP